jgi:hypothetical protein
VEVDVNGVEVDEKVEESVVLCFGDILEERRRWRRGRGKERRRGWGGRVPSMLDVADVDATLMMESPSDERGNSYQRHAPPLLFYFQYTRPLSYISCILHQPSLLIFHPVV